MKDVKYVLHRGYETNNFFETRVLEQAVSVAMAAALSTGNSIALKRSVFIDDGKRYQAHTIDLCRIAPSTTDFRHASAELVLATNAMAHELCGDIHEVIQPTVEGSEQ